MEKTISLDAFVNTCLMMKKESPYTMGNTQAGWYISFSDGITKSANKVVPDGIPIFLLTHHAENLEQFSQGNSFDSQNTGHFFSPIFIGFDYLEPCMISIQEAFQFQKTISSMKIIGFVGLNKDESIVFEFQNVIIRALKMTHMGTDYMWAIAINFAAYNHNIKSSKGNLAESYNCLTNAIE